ILPAHLNAQAEGIKLSREQLMQEFRPITKEAFLSEKQLLPKLLPVSTELKTAERVIPTELAGGKIPAKPPTLPTTAPGNPLDDFYNSLDAGDIEAAKLKLAQIKSHLDRATAQEYLDDAIKGLQPTEKAAQIDVIKQAEPVGKMKVSQLNLKQFGLTPEQETQFIERFGIKELPVQTWDDVQKIVDTLTADDIRGLLRTEKTVSGPEMKALGQVIKTNTDEVARLSEMLKFPRLRKKTIRQIEALNNQISRAYGTISSTLTETGRTLNLSKMMLRKTFNPDYWVYVARKTAGRDISSELMTRVRELANTKNGDELTYLLSSLLAGTPDNIAITGTLAQARASIQAELRNYRNLSNKELSDLARAISADRGLPEIDKTTFLSEIKGRMGLQAREVSLTKKRLMAQEKVSREEAGIFYKARKVSGGRELPEATRQSLITAFRNGNKNEVNRILDTLKPRTFWERAMGLYRALDNPRRGLMVSQLATTMRNAISQAGIYTTRMMTDALSGVIGTVRGQSLREAFMPLSEDILSIGRRLSKEQRRQLKEILNAFPEEQERLFQVFVGDVPTRQKIVDTVNIANKSQEFFYRNLIMDAELHKWARRAGKDLAHLPPAAIPENVITDAVNEALTGTMAKRFGKGTLGGAILDIYEKAPILTTVQAFQRYLVNAYNFVYQYSPGGFLRLISPKVRAQIIAGNYEALSKAIIGTGFLAGGLGLRLSPIAGDKWYEIKIGGKTIDLRPYGPFAAYLFLGELIKAAIGYKTALSGRDITEGLLSVRPLAGTTLTLFDLVTGRLDSKNAIDRVYKSLKRGVGEWVGGFTVSFRTLVDLISAISPEESISRTTRESPLIGPTIRNIPFLGRQLPRSPRITRGEPYKTEYPVLKQLTGFRAYTKTPLEAEIDRLGLNLYPRTPNPKFSRYIAEEAGKLIDENPDLRDRVLDPDYKERSDLLKAMTIKVIYEEVREAATFRALERLIEEGMPLEEIRKLMMTGEDYELWQEQEQMQQEENPFAKYDFSKAANQ
ncbi:MAG: hypothetical protein QME51_04525, partial [Planctomycetota bacterium]|nr:hypothetical protein [Planctomycetota bacterium]